MLKKEDKKEKALKEIKDKEDQSESPKLAKWSELTKEKKNAQKIQVLIKGFIPSFQKKIEKNLLILANRILPLRGRSWEWVNHPNQKQIAIC